MPQGVTKASVRASPNGYYFIPLDSTLVQDPGQRYALQVDAPAGWSVSPIAADGAVSIDETLVCNAGADFNFRFSGFTLSGRVASMRECLSASGTPAAAGVRLTLTTASGHQPAGMASAATTAMSDANGAFSFVNVPAASYVVTASHPTWQFAQTTISVDVETEPVQLGAPFVVSGYDASGVVQSSGEPVPNVNVFLFSAAVAAVDCRASGDQSLPDGLEVPRGMKLLCAVATGETGVFVFSGLPCGAYTVVPRHQSAVATFDLAPKSAAFTIGGASFRFAEPFLVQGFSVTGRVLTPSGRGVAGASVSIDGASRATTAADGSFSISRLASGLYDVTVAKEHLFFSSLLAHRISPAATRLPDIVVTGYHVCGKLTLAVADFSLADQRVLLSSATDGDLLETHRVDARDGSFCFEVAPGHYVLSIKVSPADAARGLVLAPAERHVSLTAEPVLDADFAQARVSVSGRVQCLSSPCPLPAGVSLVLKLVPSSGAGVPLQVSANAKTGIFSFPDVLPGSYSLSAHADGLCWERPSLAVTVGTEDVASLKVQQKGFELRVSTSHAATLTGTVERAAGEAPGEVAPIALAPGETRTCLTLSGRYSFAVAPAGACVEFGATAGERVHFDTAAPQPLTLAASRLRYFGHVDVSRAALGTGAKPPTVIALRVTDEASGEAHELSAQLASGGAGADPLRYDYAGYARAGARLSLAPRADTLLFTPGSRETSVSAGSCTTAVPSFSAERGVYLTGSVSPPERGTSILVFDASQADAEPLLVTETDAHGKFSAGPLRGSIEYRLAARREGFHFKQLDRGVFRAVRLGSLVVSVRTATGAAVEGALLSLSGDEFRSNRATGADGMMRFTDLMPGEYYLRPLLKEHAFEPDAQSLEIGEGREQTVTLVARRVAFSILGRVTALNGQPDRGLVVEAHALDSNAVLESATTDSDGSYRLRGFAPEAQVQVSVRTGDGRAASKAVPAVRLLVMPQADATGINFVAFRPVPRMEISGRVSASTAEALASLTVELVPADNAGSVVETAKPALLGFYRFAKLAPGSYIVRLRSSLKLAEYSYKPVSLTVRADDGRNSSIVGACVTADLHFDASRKQETAAEIARLPFVLFSLLVLAIVAFVYRRDVQQFLSDVSYEAPVSLGFEPQQKKKSSK